MTNDFKNYQPAADLLADRIILVTGASDGIGKAVAKGLAQYGATVILHGKNVKKLEALYDDIEASGYPQPAMTPLDLGTATELEYQQFTQAIGEEFGRLDAVIHNAGILGDLSPIEHYEKATWDKVLQINLTATFSLTQATLPLLKESKDASIVFTSSGVGRQARAYWGAYAVSKFGVEALMQILADELETNTSIRCNSLNPGATRTAMRAKAFPGEDAEILPRPEQLLPAYLYLCGADSSKENGKAFNARDFFTL